MKQIILIQHCEATHHVNNEIGGWTDTDLTDLGHRQAIRISEFVTPRINSDNCWIITSDLKRTIQTAEPLSKVTGVSIESFRELREYNCGDAHYKTREEAKAYENEIPDIPPGIDWRLFPNAET